MPVAHETVAPKPLSLVARGADRTYDYRWHGR